MKTFWLSWWDPIDTADGVEESGIAVWCSGKRTTRGDEEQESLVALVVAETENAAWAKLNRYYPGAATAERRFSQEHAVGWRPGDRFKLSSSTAADIAAFEAHG